MALLLLALSASIAVISAAGQMRQMPTDAPQSAAPAPPPAQSAGNGAPPQPRR